MSTPPTLQQKREWWVRLVPANFAPNLDPHLSRPQFLRRSSRNHRRISHNPRRRRTLRPNSPPMGEGSQSQSESRSYTVDAALVSMGFGRFQLFVLAYAGMGWISEAMEVMLLSFIGPSVQLEWNLSSREESMITSVVFAGMLIGAYSWGIVSDNHGRRMGFLFTALVTSGAGFLSSFAPNYITLIVLRFVVGIGLGGGPVLASWFLEFIPVPNRGTWMVVFSSFWTLGTILEASLAWVVMPTFGWRWLLALSSLPSFLLLLCYSLTPESPRYLCMKGRKTEAVYILEKIARVNNVDVPSGILVSDHEVELEEISNPSEDARLISVPKNNVAISEDVESSIGGITALLKLLQPKLLRSTLLLWMVFFGNAFSYYGIVLLTSELNNGKRKCASKESLLRSSSDSLYKDVFITSFAEVPGLVLSAAIVDRIGRKLSMSSMLFISSMFLIPLVFNQTEVLTTTLLFGARTCISGSFSIVYIYAPEIYPTSLRSTGVGIASSVARIGGIICPLVAVGLVHGCHQTAAVLLFNLVLILSGFAVFFFPFETSGRGLSDTVQS